jgi:hypothetical protein
MNESQPSATNVRLRLLGAAIALVSGVSALIIAIDLLRGALA